LIRLQQTISSTASPPRSPVAVTAQLIDTRNDKHI